MPITIVSLSLGSDDQPMSNEREVLENDVS